MKKAQNIARLHIATPEALRQAVQEAASMRMQSANSYVRQALREAPIAVCAPGIRLSVGENQTPYRKLH